MAARFRIHSGVSDPLIFICESLAPGASAFAPVDLTGATCPAVRLKNQASGCTIAFAACVAITTASAGEVTLSQSASDLPAGNYSGFVRVIDAASKVVDFPSSDFFTLEVGQVF